MYLGKIATLLGILSLICILAIGISEVYYDGINSPLVTFVSTFLNFDGQLQSSEVVLKPVSMFDIYETNIVKFLSIITVTLSILSGVLAVLAAKHEDNSLWYSLAVFLSGFALLEINYLIAGVFVATCLVLIMNIRNWKLSKA